MYTMEYYSAIKKNTFQSVLMRYQDKKGEESEALTSGTKFNVAPKPQSLR